MRVLHINNTSHVGGAARAMQRLHNALVDKGHQSRFLVGRSIDKENPLIRLIWDEVAPYRTALKSVQSRIGNLLEEHLGIHPWANRPTLHITDTESYKWAEIIDLRNLFGGFFNLWSLPALSRHKPVVWRLPDLWAVTGHCAYPYDCQRWQTGCFQCPLLKGEGRQLVEPTPTTLDGTRRIWKAKQDLYQNSNIHVIVTTRWMEEQVRKSILKDSISINVISNGVNLDIFKPIPKAEAREKLGLDPSGQYLLWAAGGKGNRRKGYHLAVGALESMQESGDRLPGLLTMGGNEGWDQPDKLSDIKHFGYLPDSDKQALVYSAADAFLCTTLADGQPQTALESMACGTPVIGFDVGPMPGLIENGRTGLIAAHPSTEALRSAIISFYKNVSNHETMQKACREKALMDFDLDKQTDAYVRLYEEILSNR